MAGTMVPMVQLLLPRAVVASAVAYGPAKNSTNNKKKRQQGKQHLEQEEEEEQEAEKTPKANSKALPSLRPGR